MTFFFLEMLLQRQIFRAKYKDTYSNCPKNQKLPEILQAGGASAPPDPPLPTPMSTIK